MIKKSGHWWKVAGKAVPYAFAMVFVVLLLAFISGLSLWAL